MLLEIKKLLESLNRAQPLFGGGGGSKDKDDKDDESSSGKDPFENFDFTRFKSSRPQPENSTPKSSDSAKSKDKDKDSAKNKPASDDAETLEAAEEADANVPFPFVSAFNSRSSSTGGGGRRSGQSVQVNQNRPRMNRRSLTLLIIGALVVGFFLFGPRVVSTWVDLMWFEELGQSNVFWTRILFPLVVFVGAFAFAFAVILLNVTIARRFGPTGPTVTPSPDNPLSVLISGGLRFLNTIFILLTLFVSFLMASAASSNWENIVLFFNATPWTERETIFNNPIGFYIFDVPFYSFLQGWLLGLVIVVLLGVMAIYFLRFTLANQRFQFTPAIKTHASVLGALLLGLFAFGYQIANWTLVYSTRGKVFTGGNATDFEAQAPANTIMTVIVAIAALLLVANIFIRDLRRGVQLLAGACAVWLVTHVLIAVIYPSLYQNFSITPNAITKERTYIQNALDMTRKGYGVQLEKNLQVVPFQGTATLTSQDIQTNSYIQENARLWDYDRLRGIYDLTQALRPYYDFVDIDIDRYNLNQAKTQVLISTRELRPEGITNQTWQSLRLQYTHGYGLQASPVNQVDTQGRPLNLIGQSFPYSSTILPVDQPRIYFSQVTRANDYSVVGTNLDELDYPFQQQGAPEAKYKYTGTGGIKLSNFFVKAAFSTELGDFNLLISDAVNENSRIIFRRSVLERVRELAPFLRYDNDPYIVVADGKLYWMLDAYTVSSRFPHSEFHERGTLNAYNYIRNSVKITIDAYNGTTNFYLLDKPEVDPLARTYATIYPSLFKPFAQMPDSLKAHIRYPETLFKVQTEILTNYHVTDPTVFFNRQDVWQIPADPTAEARGLRAGPMEPYYLVTRLPGETTNEFGLISAFQPQNRPTLVSQIIGRSDGDNYGKLVLYSFDPAVNIDSPTQFYAKVQALPDFSRQQSLFNAASGTSKLPPGPVIMIPVDKSVLYVMPFYLQGQNAALPQLQFVAVGVNEQVFVAQAGTDDDRTKLLPTALRDVFTRGQQVAVGQPGTNPATNPTPGALPTPANLPGSTPGATPASGANVPLGPTVAPNQTSSIADLVRSIAAHQELARQAFAAGDTARGNAELRAASEDLARLNQILGR